ATSMSTNSGASATRPRRRGHERRAGEAEAGTGPRQARKERTALPPQGRIGEERGAGEPQPGQGGEDDAGGLARAAGLQRGRQSAPAAGPGWGGVDGGVPVPDPRDRRREQRRHRGRGGRRPGAGGDRAARSEPGAGERGPDRDPRSVPAGGRRRYGRLDGRG